MVADGPSGGDRVSGDAAPVCLRAEHAVELAELVEFLGDWLDGAPGVVADSLAGFCGNGYSTEELRADLARLSFLLGSYSERFVFGDDR